MIATYITALSVCTLLVSLWMLVMACHHSSVGKALNVDDCGDRHECAGHCAMTSVMRCDNRQNDSGGKPVANSGNFKGN